MKMSNAIHYFLSEYNNQATRRAYSDVLTPLAEFLGDPSVMDIQPVNLVAYGNALREKPYTAATRLKHIKTVKIFFNWLVRQEVLQRSPARALRQEKPPRRISRDKAMKDDELERLLSYAQWRPRDHALILFVADTGCRAGGAASLRLADLDLAHRRATVNEKGATTRMVFFGEECEAALRRWLKSRKADSEFVFGTDGGAMTSASISQAIRRACQHAGIRSLGSHSLRHRKGHQFADAHIAPSVAATVLGHSDVMTTLQNYYPSDWDTAEREARRLVVGAEETPANVIAIQKTGTF